MNIVSGSLRSGYLVIAAALLVGGCVSNLPPATLLDTGIEVGSTASERTVHVEADRPGRATLRLQVDPESPASAEDVSVRLNGRTKFRTGRLSVGEVERVPVKLRAGVNTIVVALEGRRGARLDVDVEAPADAVTITTTPKSRDAATQIVTVAYAIFDMPTNTPSSGVVHTVDDVSVAVGQ